MISRELVDLCLRRCLNGRRMCLHQGVYFLLDDAIAAYSQFLLTSVGQHTTAAGQNGRRRPVSELKSELLSEAVRGEHELASVWVRLHNTLHSSASISHACFHLSLWLWYMPASH